MMEWLQEALKLSHQDKINYHKDSLSKLEKEYKFIQNKINKMYDDKLSGRIDEFLWESKYKEFRESQDQIQLSMKAPQKADDAYIDSGIKLLELAQNASKIFQKGSPAQKREILKFVLSNSKLTSETIEFEFKKPFDMLVEVSKSGK